MEQPAQPVSAISDRAKFAWHQAAANHMWDILDDAWCHLTNPTGYINVAIAENTLMQDSILEFINTTKLELPAECLTYSKSSGGSERLKRALCQFLNRHLHPAVELTPEHLLVTNGVSPAIEHVAWALTNPGEALLLGRPYYGFFAQDVSLRPQTEVIPVDFHGADPFDLGIIDRYEKALLSCQQSTGKSVKGLLLCNPHNPLGRCYSKAVITRLMQLCQKYEINLISDESFALSTWENTVDQHPSVPFQSVLSINLDKIIDPSLVHVLWGMSKDFGANGVRLGALISQANRDLHLALKGPCIYSQVSGITDHFMSLLLENAECTDTYIRSNQKRLSEAHAYAIGFLRQHGIEHAPGSNAGFFLWLNLGKAYREQFSEMSQGEDAGDAIMQRLLEHKVCLTCGAAAGSEQDGWFRFVFSHERAYLQEALQRVVAVLQK